MSLEPLESETPPDRDVTNGQFKKGKQAPLDKRCQHIRRSTGEQCKQWSWRVTKEGKRICHFHDPSRRRYKGQKTNKMSKNYRKLGPALERLLGAKADRSNEVEALSLLEETQLMRASVEPFIAAATMVLLDEKAEQKAKQEAAALLQMAIRQVEASVQAAARVRTMVSGVISPQQVREVVDQFIVILRNECGETAEGQALADRINARLWQEIKLPTGEGNVQGTRLTPADTVVREMDSTIPFVTEDEDEHAG